VATSPLRKLIINKIKENIEWGALGGVKEMGAWKERPGRMKVSRQKPSDKGKQWKT